MASPFCFAAMDASVQLPQINIAALVRRKLISNDIVGVRRFKNRGAKPLEPGVAREPVFVRRTHTKNDSRRVTGLAQQPVQ